MKTKFLITCLFVLGLTTSAIAAQCWGPNCNTGVSLGQTFSQGSGSGSSVSKSTAPSSGSSYGKSKGGSSGSIFSSNYNGPMSGTILNDTGGCSNKGRAILEDGPCMKACPGKCKGAPTPCQEDPNDLPCCQDQPEPCPAMAATMPPPPPPCMSSPCLPVAHPVNYVNMVNTPPIAQCGRFAPIELQWVDFRIPEEGKVSYNKKLGNYRFRIFGCRRPAKNMMLNQGRTLQKDMRLIEVFERTTGDCLNIVKIPTYLCLDTKARLPEYILTAEIVDYHMNVCDEFDYYDAQTKNSRKGSSEITVIWRVLDLTKTNVLWKGTTTGYGELEDGEPYGENTLIEKAFADASNSLRQDPGFEAQLMRRVNPRELGLQRSLLIDAQRLIDPAKCDYGPDLAAIRAGQRTSVSIFEKQFVRKDGSKIYITRDGVKVYRDKGGRVVHIIRDGTTYPVDYNTIVINEDGTKILRATDGTRIVLTPNDEIITLEYDNRAPVLIKDVEIVEPVRIVEEVTIKEPVAVIKKTTPQEKTTIVEEVTVKEPVAVIEKVTTTPAIFEEEKIETIDRSGTDTLFDVTLIEDDLTVNSDSRICIYERGAYDSLSTENMSLIKSSIVVIENASGKKGSGIIVSEDLILTSANMIVKDKNSYTIKTTDGRTLTAKAFRINVKKNIALLLLDKETQYNKLAIGLELPRIGKDELTSLGILPLDKTPFTTDKSFTEAKGKTLGYRYSDDIGTELIVDTFIQGTTDGGTVIDDQGRYRGMSISGKRLGDGPDIFIPFETALKSVGLEICGREFEKISITTELIEKPIAGAPEKMDKKKRK